MPNEKNAGSTAVLLLKLLEEKDMYGKQERSIPFCTGWRKQDGLHHMNRMWMAGQESITISQKKGKRRCPNKQLVGSVTQRRSIRS